MTIETKLKRLEDKTKRRQFYTMDMIMANLFLQQKGEKPRDLSHLEPCPELKKNEKYLIALAQKRIGPHIKTLSQALLGVDVEGD